MQVEGATTGNGAVLVPHTDTPRTPSLLDMEPTQMVAQASTMAKSLKDVIDRQRLYTEIGGNRHVRAEGWSLCGSMLNVYPREVEVSQHDDGTFEAVVELINGRTGMVIGRGSAICGSDESTWKSRPRYARRSMAITRATSKAYKSAFSWVISLAGYNATPAEEMEGLDDHKKTYEAPTTKTATTTTETTAKATDTKTTTKTTKKKSTGLTYKATPEQKKELIEICATRGVTQDKYGDKYKAILTEVSETVKGKTMAGLPDHVNKYLDTVL